MKNIQSSGNLGPFLEEWVDPGQNFQVFSGLLK